MEDGVDEVPHFADSPEFAKAKKEQEAARKREEEMRLLKEFDEM